MLPFPMSFGEALVKADISGLLLTNFLKLSVWGGFSLECTIYVATLAGFPQQWITVYPFMNVAWSWGDGKVLAM